MLYLSKSRIICSNEPLECAKNWCKELLCNSSASWALQKVLSPHFLSCSLLCTSHRVNHPLLHVFLYSSELSTKRVFSSSHLTFQLQPNMHLELYFGAFSNAFRPPRILTEYRAAIPVPAGLLCRHVCFCLSAKVRIRPSPSRYEIRQWKLF